MKTKIHFHTDCSFFAGCENILVNFFNNSEFMQNYEVSFSYRWSSIYEKGFKEKVSRDLKIYPLMLLDPVLIYNYFDKFIFPNFKIIIRIASNFFLMKYFFILYNTVVLSTILKKRRVDILCVNNGGYPGACSCMSAVFAAKVQNINKIVYIVNNFALSYNSLPRMFDFPLDILVRKFVTQFVTGSRYSKERLTQVLRLKPNKAINIYNGVMPGKITQKKKEFLSNLFIDDGRLLFAVGALLEKRKGHFYLLKALNLLKNYGYSDELPIVIIAGIGPQLKKLTGYVKKFALSQCVKFVKYEKNIFNLLNAVDIVILPSIANEDFPYIILEAMSLGKAVIASSIAGIPEQIEDMKSGILVEPKDVDGLAKAIRLTIENENLRKLIGENARKRFNESFTADFAVNRYRELFCLLLN